MIFFTKIAENKIILKDMLCDEFADSHAKH